MYKYPPHSDHDGRGSKDEAAGDKHEGAREVAEGGVVDEAVEGARDEGHEGAHQRQAGEHSPNLALVHTLAETDDVLSVPGRGLFSFLRIVWKLTILSYITFTWAKILPMHI